MKSIDKSYSQIGASLIVTLAGSPDAVEIHFNRLLNHGMVQMEKLGAEDTNSGWSPEITAGNVGKDSISFKTNLPRFERSIRALAIAKLRTTKKGRKMKARGLKAKQFLKFEIEKIKSEFMREITPLKQAGGIRMMTMGNHGKAGSWEE